MRLFLLLLPLAMMMVGCSSGEEAANTAPAPSSPASVPVKPAAESSRRHDESSYAESDKVRITD
ncbi:MAG: hypothetical protein LBV45_00680, partial [Xanthomonadaceae bacterium]|nr:hypothetical protein [Xanthomonadaceae bacterium]